MELGEVQLLKQRLILPETESRPGRQRKPDERRKRHVFTRTKKCQDVNLLLGIGCFQKMLSSINMNYNIQRNKKIVT